MAKAAKRTRAQKRAEKTYEQSGQRAGTPVGTRLSDEALARFDHEKGEGRSRSEFLTEIIYAHLRINAPARKRRLRPPSGS